MKFNNSLVYLKFLAMAAVLSMTFFGCSKHSEQRTERQAKEGISRPAANQGTFSDAATDSRTAGMQPQNASFEMSADSPDFRVSLQPNTPVTGDQLSAKVEHANGTAEGEALTYLWLVNGEKVQESGDPNLNHAVQCDDFVELQVSRVGAAASGAKSCSTLVGNAPPQLKLISQGLDQTGLYQARIEASDPEKDLLSLSLTQCPPGMRIDQQAQTIQWTVPPDQQGTFEVALAAKDRQGAEAFLSYQMSISWKPSERTEDHEGSTEKTE